MNIRKLLLPLSISLGLSIAGYFTITNSNFFYNSNNTNSNNTNSNNTNSNINSNNTNSNNQKEHVLKLNYIPEKDYFIKVDSSAYDGLPVALFRKQLEGSNTNSNNTNSNNTNSNNTNSNNTNSNNTNSNNTNSNNTNSNNTNSNNTNSNNTINIIVGDPAIVNGTITSHQDKVEEVKKQGFLKDFDYTNGTTVYYNSSNHTMYIYYGNGKLVSMDCYTGQRTNLGQVGKVINYGNQQGSDRSLYNAPPLFSPSPNYNQPRPTYQ